MKTIKKWQQFNEENVYGQDWTTNTTNIPEKPVQQPNKRVQQPNKPVQQYITQSAQSNYKTYFYVPCVVEKPFKYEEIFIYNEDPIKICQELERIGYDDCWWFEEQFNNWKEYAKPENPGDEPEREDFEDEDEYNAKLSEWDEKVFKYDNWQPTIEEYVEDEWGGKWYKFISQFDIKGLVCDVTGEKEQQKIFDKLQKDFNDSDLVKNFDDAERLGITSIKVIGDNFNPDSTFTVEVKSIKNLDEIDIVKDYLESQFSDGWGESFEQEDIEGYSVHTWWGRYNEYNVGKYKIKVEK